ncbi:hypothetical protein HRbin02_01666 [Candidatus Calditenuaceae archaeon HR02]|nr:hypothetical protein HRbin02_01666 [Candidatus Calditenuaceae archaeon HR02]
MSMRRAVQITLGLGRTVGGGEYTALVCAQVLKETGYILALITKRLFNPDIYYKSFGVKAPFDEIAIFKYPKLPKIAKLYHYLFYPLATPNIKAKLYFNTSADSHPFVFPLYALTNQVPIVYYVTAVPLTPPWYIKDHQESNNSHYTFLFRFLAKNYWKKLNTLFLACSKYVANIVEDATGIKPYILYTPVDIRNYLWKKEKKDDYAVVMGRLVPSKKYEDAILACKEAGKRLIMLLATQDQDYHKKIMELIRKLNMGEHVKILLNQPIDVRAEILKRAKIFIQCRTEAGAKAVREAMAAGCIPIVPREGGQSEYVPQEYTYTSFGELVEKIMFADKASVHEREYMVEQAKQYDTEVFKRRLKDYLISNGLA